MAATDLERLVVQLSADIKKYENALSRAQGITNQRLNAIQRKASTSSTAIAASFAKAGVQIAGAFVTAAAVQNLARLSDQATKIDNALKIAGLSGQELEQTYEKLAAAAKANGAPLQSLVGLYSKVSLVQNELNISSDELIGFTNNVALALRVGGTSAQEASGALLQLSQALGGGVVRAEEFNSILEGAPTILQAAAAGLREADGSVAKLRQIMLEGELSSRALFRAFEAGSVILEQKAARATQTLDQATTNLQTALLKVAREFNNSTGASERFAGGINNAANAISNFDVSGFLRKIQEAKSELDGFLNDLGNAQIFQNLNQALGVSDGDGNVINIDATKAKEETAGLEREVQLLQERIAVNTRLGFDNTEAVARLNEVIAKLKEVKAASGSIPATVDGYQVGDNGIAPATGSTNGQMGGSRIRGGARRVKVPTVSIKDFPASDSGSGKKSRPNEFQRETEQIRERTAALNAETEAQARVNPLVNDYGYAVEFARTKQDLLTAAQEAGLQVTPALAKSIDDLAAGYATASVSSEILAEKQDEIRQRAEDALATAKDVTRGIIDGFVDGADAADILADSLKRIGNALLNDVLDNIFKVNNASSGGGFLSSIFGSLFGGGSKFPAAPVGLYSDGGYTGPGGKYQPAGIVHKGEYVFDAEATRRIGVDNLRRLQGYAQGGLVGAPSLPKIGPAASGAGGATGLSVDIGVRVDQNGNLVALVEKISQRNVKQGIAQYDKGGAYRTARDLRQVNQRGYAK